MGSGRVPPLPSDVTWASGDDHPGWALWLADHCDHRGRLPGDHGARSAAARLPDYLYCSRPRGHHGEHAAPARGWFARYAGGWWSWPDEADPDQARTRERQAARRHGALPEVAGPGQPRCQAHGEITRASPGPVAVTRRVERVRCARPQDHPPPHRSAPERVRPSLPGLSPEKGRRPGGWGWWEWPRPPVAEPTDGARRGARAQQLLGLLLLVLVLAWLVLSVIARYETLARPHGVHGTHAAHVVTTLS